MKTSRSRLLTNSAWRMFVIYATVSLVPVLAIGIVLLHLLNAQGNATGLAQGRADANLIARTAIAPLLDGDALRAKLAPAERADLNRSVGLAVRDGQILRLRLRDMSGRVVFADDGSTGPADDEALDAAHGEVISSLTRLNADDGDTGPRGPRVVEVYEPLDSAQSGHRIGVLELYLPYAPIAADISRGHRVIAATLGAGLLTLWLTLALVTASVTGRLRRQAKINSKLAREDALTGLPNRTHFTTLVADATAAATLHRPTAIGVIDLDRFKQVNDSLGHDFGDQLLVLLAQRLEAHVRRESSVARLGGDEFGIVLPDVHDAPEACEQFDQLRNALAEPIEIDGLPLAVEASIGFALAPFDGTEAGQLIQHAEVAMYAAKQQHLGVLPYRAEHNQHDSCALRLIGELGAAITADQLVLHYQPKVDVGTGTVTSFEALVRWQHPTHGMLYPDAFLPAAEQTELIEALTWWVLRRATLALPVIDPTGSVSIAVNISARSLIRPGFADDVLAVLAATNTDPGRVILEMTETALLVDPPQAVRTLNRLHDAGIRVSIDDFGAGQTSLRYLAMLPINELKIDKSFVMSMLTDRRNAAIVRSVIDLGHSLGFTVTAEGVEDVETLRRLTVFDCDTAQGYLLARPAPVVEVRRWLAARSAIEVAPRRLVPAPR